MKLCKRQVDEEDGCWVSLADRLSIRGGSSSCSGSSSSSDCSASTVTARTEDNVAICNYKEGRTEGTGRPRHTEQAIRKYPSGWI